MKQFIILIGLFCCFNGNIFCQDKSYFFDEYAFSVNRTILEKKDFKGRIGFGAGVKNTLRRDKALNITLGLEYNRTSQLVKYIYNGHFSRSEDVTYTLNYFSIPVGLRFNLGSNPKFFIESGGYLDLVIASREKGTNYSYSSYGNPDNVTKFNRKADVSDSYGLYLAFGLRTPVFGHELLICPEYKFGFNDVYRYYDPMYSRYLKLNIGVKF
jgi:hypothetical protein